MTVSKMSRTNSFQPPPVFNKRLFKAQAGIVLTEEILDILKGTIKTHRSMTELNKLKSVVTGLKDIHKGLQYIKDALAYVITYEKVDSGKTVTKKRNEKLLSCYYILNGSVEAKYSIDYDEEQSEIRDREDMKNGKPFMENVDCEINYTHVAGDYLGLVSADGPQFDLPPPDSMKTMEVCEFLRIDREKFHQAIKMVQNRHVREIEHFIENSEILRKLPTEERANLVPLMAKQEYPAGKVIIDQSDLPEHIFFVGKGRCQYFRRVYIGEARRLELVRLGQIEKGGFFGESTLLSNSPCFCSVTSIGPVACYLVNKWAIKTNEHILNLLRDHQHYFHADEMIKHFIRDSDVWQSYKRSKVLELLEGTDKQHVMVDKDSVSDTLSTAVDFGDAMRRQSTGYSLQEREPGEPKKEEPLFVPPRSRRRSSAILHSNAAAVVKAVLLLRRNVDTLDGGFTPRRTEPPAPSPIRLPRIRDAEKPKRKRIKPSSAPGRFRTVPKPAPGSPNSPPMKCHSKVKVNSQENTEVAKARGNPRTNTSTSCRPKEKKTTRKIKSADFKPKKKRNPNDSRISLSSPQEEEEEDLPQTPPSPSLEKIVSSTRNFIVKEVINTGVPGKRALSPGGFKRFEKSMFGVMDEPRTEHAKLHFGPSPWSMAIAANKWMSSVRRKRAELRRASGRNTPSPTVPPIIVIEEYSPANETNPEENVLEDDRSSPAGWSTRRSVSRTPPPALQELREENDDEVQEYERHEAGKPVPKRWYTPIHEARDQSRSHLQKVKVELEVIKKERDMMRRQLRMRHGSAVDTAEREGDDASAHDQKQDHAEQESEVVESQSSTSSASKKNLLTRQQSNHSPTRRQRSRTFSSGHGSEATRSTTRRTSLGPNHTNQLTRTGFLGGCLSDSKANKEFTTTAHAQTSSLESQCGMLNCDQENSKKLMLSRNEKRRLLLLRKLGLR